MQPREPEAVLLRPIPRWFAVGLVRGSRAGGGRLCRPWSSGVDAPAASVGQRVDAVLPAAVSAPVLVGSTGRRFDLASLTGKVVVVSDMMTLCQETCPLDTANVVAAARAAARAGLGDRVEFLSITIDPRRDTPQRLAPYRALYAPAPDDWIVATATGEQLAALWKALGVYIERVADGRPRRATGSPASRSPTTSPTRMRCSSSTSTGANDSCSTARRTSRRARRFRPRWRSSTTRSQEPHAAGRAGVDAAPGATGPVLADRPAHPGGVELTARAGSARTHLRVLVPGRAP